MSYFIKEIENISPDISPKPQNVLKGNWILESSLFYLKEHLK